MEEKITNYKIDIMGLYRTDYARSFHARAMAKLLGTSHVTLLPHLKQLETGKILASRRIGRNKEYVLNLDNIVTKEYLIVAEKLETIRYLEKNFLIKKISERLLNLDIMGSIVLFGSYVKDYATKASDIDLFYLGKLSETQMEEIKNAGKTYGKEVNVKTSSIENFNDGLKTGDTLIKEIINGHIILQNPDLFINAMWRHHVER